jgi:hypothetical protein
LEDEMKRTEKFVDGILKKNKQELQKVAYGALHNYLFTKINDELIEPSSYRQDLCTPLIQDISEKIDLFLVAEGYNNGEKNEYT